MNSPMSLVEIELDSGPRWYSFEGAGIPGEGWYSDKLGSVGTVFRESPIQPSRPRLGDSSIEINDLDLLVAKASQPFRNRTVRYRFGDASKGPADITTLYTGKIIDVQFENGSTAIRVRDGSYDRFRVPLSGRLNRVDFPLMPSEFTPRILPTIYGELTTATDAQTGAVACYRITDTTPFQYLVARHVCKSILNVYKYGVLMSPADWTAATIMVGAVEMQVVEFTVDPRTAARPNEFEITVDVQGKTDDGTAGGSLIVLPARQLEDYLVNELGIAAAALSSTHFDAAAALQSTEGYVGAAWIASEATQFDVLARFSISFLMPFFLTREGLYAISQLTANGIFSLAGDFTAITDEHDIFRRSFKILSNNDVASLLEYSYALQWAHSDWQRITEQENLPELANLGQEIRQSHEMHYVYDSATANRVASARLLVSAENQQFVEFEVPASYHRLDLNDVVLITHHFGLGSGGYAAVPFRIVALEITLEPTEARVKVIAARNVDDLAHCDTHADAHADLAHVDLAHTDTAHGDSHNDAAHGDVAHLDTHNDTPHGDNVEHFDLHDDGFAQHGDDHIDYPFPTHQDSHDDHNDNTHFDVHEDVSHSDVGHTDSHTDVAHTDGHTDSHTDSVHADGGHTDTAHEDTEHDDYHCDTDLDHTDVHTDVGHVDTAHVDSHTDDAHADTEHADAAHVDSHNDTAHTNVAHSDVAHANAHTDYNETHTDNIDNDGITSHSDHTNIIHGDTHTDTHGDTAHSDVAHVDSHTDTHTDTAHADTAHGDAAHSDTAHGDAAHSDVAHEDHNDVHHGDE